MITRVLASVVLAVLSGAVAIAPLLLQQPFGAQTPSGMAAAHAARYWGTPITIALAAATIAALWPVASRVRWWAQAFLALPVALALGSIWFARENPFEWWFNGLPQPRYVKAAEASFVEPGDLVLAVSQDGDAIAYPVRLIAYHHIVNDRIGRTPAVVTY